MSNYVMWKHFVNSKPLFIIIALIDLIFLNTQITNSSRASLALDSH